VIPDGPVRNYDAECSLSPRSKDQNWSLWKSGAYECAATARKGNTAGHDSGIAASNVGQEWRWSIARRVSAFDFRDNSESVLIISISRSSEITLVFDNKSYWVLKTLVRKRWSLIIQLFEHFRHQFKMSIMKMFLF
jgi:hypothetical protein